MNYKLQATEDDEVITHEFTAIQISDVLEHLEKFMRAAGLCFDGELNIFDEPIEGPGDEPS